MELLEVQGSTVGPVMDFREQSADEFAFGVKTKGACSEEDVPESALLCLGSA